MRLYQQHFKAMGSPCQIQLYCNQEEQAQQTIRLAIAEINRLEQKYSRYLKKSFLSQINHSAGNKQGIKIDNETASLLNYADHCYQQSDGLFDITAGVLNQAWDFNVSKLPSKSLIAQQLGKVGWDKVDWHAPYLILPIKGMALDFGGIVKEYAVDSAATICLKQEIKHGLIELGGDIRALGAHPNGKAWQVGIRHPRKSNTLLTQLQLYTGAIASSGDYERYIKVNGKRYCHILNPKTGYPINSQYLKAVSVITEHCIIAGSFASIALLKEKDGEKWLKQSGIEYLSYG